MFVVNETPYPIKAAVIKWTIAASGDVPQIRYTVIYPEPTRPFLIPGKRKVIPPSKVALVSPLGYAEEENDDKQSGREFMAAYRSSSEVNMLKLSTSIDARIDSVIFGNFQFLGADQAGFIPKFGCEHNGAILEAIELEPLISDLVSLKRRMEADSMMTGSPDDNACTSSKAREALRLQHIFSNKGDSGGVDALMTLASRPQILVHRLSKPTL